MRSGGGREGRGAGVKFCARHWDMLRQALDERGLTPLVATSGAEAAARAQAELAGTATDATYDPLMACHWAIAGRAMAELGLYLLQGDLCPVCEALRVHRETMGDPCPHGCTDDDIEAFWIQGPAEAARRYVEESPVLRAMRGISTEGGSDA